MKFALVEKFTSLANRDIHYTKHVLNKQEFGDAKHFSPEDYERNADILQRTPVDHNNILGYVRLSRDENGKEIKNYVKYNKNTGEYVSYTMDDEPRTITYFKRDYRRYMDKWMDEYHDEIPVGK